MKRKILITGASGFVGRHVRTALETMPGDAEILDLNAAEAGDGPDIADQAAVEAAIARLQPDAVIHLAAVALPAEARDAPARAWAVNFQGTLNIAAALRAHCPQARLIFAGSSESYGAAFALNEGPTDELTPLMPQSVYAATKACADIALGQLAAEGFDCIRFRPFNHSGPGQAPLYVVADFARQIAEIEAERRAPVIRVGNLDAERDFLDVRDVARAYALAAMAGAPQPSKPPAQPLPHSTAYNLASGRAVRIGAILDALIGMSRVSISIETDPDRLRPADIPRTIGDAGRAAAAFGWRAEIALNTTLADVLDDQRRQVAGRSD
ncbi:NAD-dependent epimerase/dehydratase family protein [Pseudohoeflea coraliihabitans]|uniref:GDP-mannose 4,6-dehydratase n=1 Tax=Pseudohoeflea coraliihabitans TaxID=2860393 RepID=A0ABS6WLP1_9HYPH|nr:GDP-mannose 4,6-dehydratase [Pseudohoeflea sp. DP4N28-3]MBW3096876.1 GDP-mannose 4,6-dehydratase [Pseudohoeflea sp. DP4N28-3]